MHKSLLCLTLLFGMAAIGTAGPDSTKSDGTVRLEAWLAQGRTVELVCYPSLPPAQRFACHLRVSLKEIPEGASSYTSTIVGRGRSVTESVNDALAQAAVAKD